MSGESRLANKLGFGILGLTNNFAYVIMLSAAYDLLKTSDIPSNVHHIDNNNNNNTNNITQANYCNAHSTSTILLADTLPSLTIKLIYPFMLVGMSMSYKAIATALFAAAAFLITGFTTTQFVIFVGVVCASLSSGLGESTYLSHTPLYGDASLSGWSMGTGAAGLVGSMAYALMRMVLPIKFIMIIMLVVPLLMMFAFFRLIKPIASQARATSYDDAAAAADRVGSPFTTANAASENARLDVMQSSNRSSPVEAGSESAASRNYGTNGQPASLEDNNNLLADDDLSSVGAKLRKLPSLAKYFLPLLLVYFAEYFINQGLFELVYYPEITFLDHAAQYRWYQVTYQVGVMISRSSLDLFRIKYLWTMSWLQFGNALLFLAHASKLIHIPSFYLVIILIVYEGLLGGFTYVNTFYRIKKEVGSDKQQEFCISTVTVADSLGIVMAGLAALPVHDALCKLYE